MGDSLKLVESTRITQCKVILYPQNLSADLALGARFEGEDVGADEPLLA